MKIAAISDIHGKLDFEVEQCDILIIAGDLCPAHHSSVLSVDMQFQWLDKEFRLWLKNQPFKECIFVGGNHDWICEKCPDSIPFLGDNFHYICDESIELFGLKIYGTPQQKYFCGWAFNRDKEELENYFKDIPEGLDILISHSPVFGIFDKVDFTNRKSHEGCKVLKKKIARMKVPPKILISGHFHNEYGIKEVDYLPGIKFVSCSLLNEQYELVKKPIYFYM